MKIIGITGGVGSGKSEVLRYLGEEYSAVVCEADLVAKNLQKKGTICYNKIIEHFGTDILDENGRIDRPHLAQIVFKNAEELRTLNSIVHPAVKKNIHGKIRQEAKKGTKLFVLEAALLLEEHYDEICDEVWYIYANEEVRKKRLKLSRGYSEEKVEDIFRAQRSRDEFLEHSDRAVDNSRDFDDTREQLDEMLKSLGIKKCHI